MELEGKTAIVTGAGRGIGRVIALCLAEEGADVVVNSLHEETAGKVVDEIKALGRKSVAVAADVTKKEPVGRVVQGALEAFGKIDILVNNFGAHTEAFYTGTSPTFVDQDISEWDDDYEFNLKSVALMSLAVVPHFIEQESGKIVNISSVAGRATVPTQMTYGAAKAGVIYFTRTLAVELGRHNINVNCVCPGGIFTPMAERALERTIKSNPKFEGMTPREFWDKFVVAKTSSPLKRELTSEDIAHATVFLASEKARNITGQSLTVDCGQTTF